MFERTGTVPHPKLVDPSAITGDVDVLELANMMLETPWEDLPAERRRLRGFFTDRSSHLFQKTMLTGNQDMYVCLFVNFKKSLYLPLTQQ